MEPLVDSKASDKYLLPTGRRDSRIDAITYTWNNINVWVGAEVKDVKNGTPVLEKDVEAAASSTASSGFWPFKKKSSGVQSKQILKNGKIYNLEYLTKFRDFI